MIRRVLVVELLGGLGDLVLALPVVHALAARHPGARVEVATCAPGDALLAADPAVAGVHVVATDAVRTGVVRALRRCAPDLVVSTTRHSDLPALLAADARRRGTRAVTDLWRRPPPDERVDRRFLRLLRHDGLVDPAARDTPTVVLTPAERVAGARILTGAAPAPAPAPVVLVTGAGMAVKRWPAPRWRRLAEELAGAGHPVLAVAGPEAPAGAAVRELPALGLRELAAVFRAVAELGGVVVGPDTGPVRVAAAVGATTVGLFGPTTADRYGLSTDARTGTDLQGFPGCPVRRPEAVTEQECWWEAACPFSRAGPLCMADLGVAEVAAAVSRRLRPGQP